MHCTAWPKATDNPQSSGRVRVRVGLMLGQGKSLFPVGRVKDQSLPAGPIATANISPEANSRDAK